MRSNTGAPIPRASTSSGPRMKLDIRVSNPLGGAAATPARTEQPGRGLG